MHAKGRDAADALQPTQKAGRDDLDGSTVGDGREGPAISIFCMPAGSVDRPEASEAGSIASDTVGRDSAEVPFSMHFVSSLSNSKWFSLS